MKVMSKDRILESKRRILRCVQEREIMSELRGHQFVVKLHFAFQTRTKVIFIMDFYAGGDLNSHLKNFGGFLQEDAAKYEF